MSTWPGKEQILIDWNDTYQFDDATDVQQFINPGDDIKDYVSNISYSFGFGVISSPAGFVPQMLTGAISLNKRLEDIPQDQLDRPHICRHIIDDNIIVECIALPVRDRTFTLTSPNTALLGDPVDKSSVTEQTDYWLWFEVMRQIGVRTGRYNLFNGYRLHEAVRVRRTLQSFLRDMMVFGGGYAFEDHLCRMNFISARAATIFNWAEYISEDHQDLSYLNISTKAGSVKNTANTSIIRARSIDRKLIRPYTFTLEGNGFRTLRTPTPEGELAGLWSVTVTSPTPQPETLSVVIADQDVDGVGFTVFNADDDDVDVQLSVFATTYDTFEQENYTNLNVSSTILYGERPLENFPDWGADNQPISEELSRLRRPLYVSRVRFPVLPEFTALGQRQQFGNAIKFLLYDTGTIFRVLDKQTDLQVDMLLGHKRVTSSDILEVEWDLVELPTNVGVYDRGWILDNDAYILGVNTYLVDRQRTARNVLTIAGRELKLNGRNLTFQNLNLLTLNNRYLTLNGNYLNFNLGENNGNV